jgi:hypothetical protein
MAIESLFVHAIAGAITKDGVKRPMSSDRRDVHFEIRCHGLDRFVAFQCGPP